jgi:hypothetical protein
VVVHAFFGGLQLTVRSTLWVKLKGLFGYFFEHMLHITFAAAQLGVSDYDVARRVATAARISFFAKQSPAGYTAAAPRGATCCGFSGTDSMAVVRSWTPSGCSGKCNETARCAAISFEPKGLLCILCARCNATSIDQKEKKEWRSFARLGTAAGALALVQQHSESTAELEDPGHGLVSSLLSEREATRWEQLPPRSRRIGAKQCDATTRKGTKGRRARGMPCDQYPHKQERCTQLAAAYGRVATCRRSCFCSRCSLACADQSLTWRSPYGLVEARATLPPAAQP